jgi:hypothetical protein
VRFVVPEKGAGLGKDVAGEYWRFSMALDEHPGELVGGRGEIAAEAVLGCEAVVMVEDGGEEDRLPELNEEVDRVAGVFANVATDVVEEEDAVGTQTEALEPGVDLGADDFVVETRVAAELDDGSGHALLTSILNRCASLSVCSAGK